MATKYPWLKNAVKLNNSDVTICEVPIAFLKSNPKNWRTHSSRQRSVFKAFKEKYGYLGFALFNLHTGLLIDGHMRVDEAHKAGEKTVPCILVDVDEDKENEILATLDNIGLLAQTNKEALESLLKSQDTTQAKLKTENERRLAQLRKDVGESILDDSSGGPKIKQSKNRLRPVKETQSEEPTSDSYNPPEKPEPIQTVVDENVLFESSNWLGLPDLLPEKLAGSDLAPVRTYTHGEEDGTDAYYCITTQFNVEMKAGTLGFYTDDYRFNDAYSNASAFVDYLTQINPTCLIAPDFSAYSWFPPIMSMYSIYKSRWCARLWQEFGYPVIPTIQIIDSPSGKLTKEYVIATLPIETPVISLECRNTKDVQSIPALINNVLSVLKPKCIVLYGGLEKQKYIHGDMPKFIPKSKTKIDYRYLPSIIVQNKKRR